MILPGIVDMARTAVISDDGLYRYALTRTWEPEGKLAVWIMLNPSTAGGKRDDPTIRRVIGFSKQGGFGAALVVNLFAYRATNPKELVQADDPVGPDNDVYLFGAMLGADAVVGAWGSTGDYATRYFRRQRVAEIAAKTGVAVWCFGTTKSGDPKHPLYLPADSSLVPWRLHEEGE